MKKLVSLLLVMLLCLSIAGCEKSGVATGELNASSPVSDETIKSVITPSDSELEVTSVSSMDTVSQIPTSTDAESIPSAPTFPDNQDAVASPADNFSQSSPIEEISYQEPSIQFTQPPSQPSVYKHAE